MLIVAPRGRFHSLFACSRSLSTSPPSHRFPPRAQDYPELEGPGAERGRGRTESDSVDEDDES